MTTKKDIEQRMKIDGRVKGTVFQTDAKYVERRFGKAKLAEVEARLKDWGAPIDYGQVRAMEWYPAGLRAISLLAIKDTLGLNDDQLFAMGLEGPKHSFLIKTLLKFFVSVKKIFDNAPLVWKRHWTVGELETVKIDEANKTMIIRLKNINLHPVFCKYEEGYFTGIFYRFYRPAIDQKDTTRSGGKYRRASRVPRRGSRPRAQDDRAGKRGQ